MAEEMSTNWGLNTKEVLQANKMANKKLFQQFWDARSVEDSQGGITDFTSWEPMALAKYFARDSGTQEYEKTASNGRCLLMLCKIGLPKG